MQLNSAGRRAIEKHGGLPPMRIRDSETGETLYDNRDATAMAKRFVARGGSASNFEWGKLDYAAIDFRCTHCGFLRARFFCQKDGFFCWECNEKSGGLDFPRDNVELITKILECQEKTSSQDEQGKLVSEVLRDYLDIHNNKYKKESNEDPNRNS